jgi:Icc protein
MVGRIAHLSDVHILGPRPSPRLQTLSMKFLSIGRKLDPQGRIKKLRQALAFAVKGGADHFVVSGDLTEVGAPEQFETFAEVLHDAGLGPASVTLVPGNHDAYTSGEAWRIALRGPLAAYAESSAGAPGKVVDRGNVVLLPLDVSYHQSIAWSAGELTAAAAAALEKRLDDPWLTGKSVVVVQHHPPFAHARRIWQWIDGLRGHARLTELLTRRPQVHLLHGHMHRMVDRIVGLGTSRIFGASATVEDREGAPRVRFYDVIGGVLEPLPMAKAG